MIINELKIIKLFCELVDFSIEFNRKISAHLMEKPNLQSAYKPDLTVSEMMCIEILYHKSGYQCFQYYYEQEVEKGYLRNYFSMAPCYNCI